MRALPVWRRVSQAAFFLWTGEWLAVGWLRCPFAVPFVSCASCPLSDCPGRLLFAWLLGLVAVSGLLVGRGFCGWACPMGLVEDLLGKLPKPGWTRRKWFAAVDRWLRPLSHISLSLGVYLVLRLNYPAERPYPYVVRNASPFDVGAVRLAWDLGANAYLVRAWLLAVALLTGLVVTRAWCRYLCPFGALLGLTNRVSLLALGRVRERCRACAWYPRECPQYTTPGETRCTVCGDCLEGCPFEAIRFRLRYRRVARPSSAAPGPTAPAHPSGTVDPQPASARASSSGPIGS